MGGFVGGLVAGISRTRRNPGAEDSRDGERLRLLTTASDVVFRYLHAPKNRFDYVSPSVEAVTGYTVEEHYGDPNIIQTLVHPNDWHVLAEAVCSEGSAASFELRWVRKTGEIVWVEQRVALIRDDGGRLVAIEGIARDVTARKEAEEALRQSEERHRALFETMTQGVVYYDGEGNVTAANPAATKILGIDVHEVRNLSPIARSWRAVREDGSDCRTRSVRSRSPSGQGRRSRAWWWASGHRTARRVGSATTPCRSFEPERTARTGST